MRKKSTDLSNFHFGLRFCLLVWLICCLWRPSVEAQEVPSHLAQTPTQLPENLPANWLEWAGQLSEIVAAIDDPAFQAKLLPDLARAQVKSGQAEAAVETAWKVTQIEKLPEEEAVAAVAKIAKQLQEAGHAEAMAAVKGKMALYYLNAINSISAEESASCRIKRDEFEAKYAKQIESGDERFVREVQLMVEKCENTITSRTGNLLLAYASFESWVGNDEDELHLIRQIPEKFSDFLQVEYDYEKALVRSWWVDVFQSVTLRASDKIVKELLRLLLEMEKPVETAKAAYEKRKTIDVGTESSLSLEQWQEVDRLEVSLLSSATFVNRLASVALKHDRQNLALGLLAGASQLHTYATWLDDQERRYSSIVQMTNMWQDYNLSKRSFDEWLKYRSSGEISVENLELLYTFVENDKGDATGKWESTEDLARSFYLMVYQLRGAFQRYHGEGGSAHVEAKLDEVSRLSMVVASQDFDAAKLMEDTGTIVFDSEHWHSEYMMINNFLIFYSQVYVAYELAKAHSWRNKPDLARHYLGVGDRLIDEAKAKDLYKAVYRALNEERGMVIAEGQKLDAVKKEKGALTPEQADKYRALKRQLEYFQRVQPQLTGVTGLQTRAHAFSGNWASFVKGREEQVAPEITAQVRKFELESHVKRATWKLDHQKE